MHELWCDNELRLLILVRNENELLWSSADHVIFVYPTKFIFSYLSYSGWIDSSTNLFEFNLVRVISDSSLHRVSSDSVQFISGYGSNRANKISGHFGFDSVISDFKLIRIITVSCWFGFGSVQFRISGRNRFNSFSRRFGSGFGPPRSGYFCLVHPWHFWGPLIVIDGISHLVMPLWWINLPSSYTDITRLCVCRHQSANLTSMDAFLSKFPTLKFHWNWFPTISLF